MVQTTAVCVIAIVAVVVIITLQTPTPVPASESMLVTYDCTDHATTSLKAQADVTDDGGDWVTRRGFQYLAGDSGDPPGIIALVNPSFEDGNAVAANWTYRNSDHASRVSDPVKTGSYALKYEYPKDTPYGFARTALFDRTEWGGRDITIGAWVKTDIGDRVRIQCYEWGGVWTMFAASSYHPGDGEWHFLIGSGTVPTDLTADFAIMVTLATTRTEDITFYADGFFAVEASELKAVFEDGEFGTGTYSLDITRLKPDTWYRIRTFAENEAGVGYGNVVSCKTLE